MADKYASGPILFRHYSSFMSFYPSPLHSELFTLNTFSLCLFLCVGRLLLFKSVVIAS